MSEKSALTPEEFAAKFGREKSWSYRQLYAGKITAITGYGRLMIPFSEVARLEQEGARYKGKKKEAKPAVAEKPHVEINRATKLAVSPKLSKGIVRSHKVVNSSVARRSSPVLKRLCRPN